MLCKVCIKAHSVPRFSHSFFRSMFMRSKSVLRMKSAEFWNYLVLCTHVYTSRVLGRPGLRESIEFSNKSVALPRVSFRIIFAWYHCLRPRHALPMRNSHAILCTTYVKHHALFFIVPRIAARGKKRKISPRKYIRIFSDCSAGHVKYPDLQ